MPKKRQTPPRPRDLNELAFHVGQLATHQIEEKPQEANGAGSLVSQRGAKGGAARAKKLTAKKRAEIASQAARARWKGR